MKGARTPKRLLAIIVCVITALLCTVPASSAFGEDDILTVGVPVNRCPIFYQQPARRIHVFWGLLALTPSIVLFAKVVMISGQYWEGF